MRESAEHPGILAMPVAVEAGEGVQRGIVCIADLPADIEVGQAGKKIIDGFESISPGREMKQALNPRADLVCWMGGIPVHTQAASSPKGFPVQSASGGVDRLPLESINRS